MYVYYSYLPAIFIHQDLTFEFINELPPDEKREIWTLVAPNGKKVQKMTMGMAMMYAPFFGMAHLVANLQDYTADGYSWIYHLFIALSALFFSIAAIFIQRELLLRYFDEKVVSFTLLAIALGTNYYYYTTSEGPMSHIYNFFLISLFVWQTVKWLETYHWKNAIWIGISFALITLIRPINVLVILIPLFYSVRSFAEFVLRIKDIFTHYFQILLILFLFGMIIFPQIWYWHMNTGDWIYYSYSDERFFFNDPRILEGLFSYRKGWLIYAPIMSLSIIGLFVLWTRSKASKFKIAILLYFIAHTYIIYSWWCWWYGGGFGSRSMIDATAIMSIPLAAFLTLSFKWKFTSWASKILVIVFVGLNLFQSMQYRRGIIHWDSMTKNSYFLIFGESNYPEGYSESLKTPDYDTAKKGDRDE
jgi:hypothetical protein